jgi:hypothetical protein
MAARKTFVPRPDHVKVGHMTFTIEYVTEQEWLETYNGYEEDGGLTFHNWAKIVIRLVPRITDQVIREVLVHEVLHAIWSVSMLSHWAGELTAEKTEEGIIQAQSPMIVGVLKENPEFLAYIIDDLEHDK